MPSDCSNPVNRLLQLAACAAGAAPPDAAGAAWLREALERHIRTGDELDRLLGVSGQRGGTSPRRQVQLERRNRHLAEALALAGDYDTLLREIRTYSDRVSGEQKFRREPCAQWSPLRRLVHAAAWQTGSRLPADERSIRSAVAAAIQSPFELQTTPPNIDPSTQEQPCRNLSIPQWPQNASAAASSPDCR